MAFSPADNHSINYFRAAHIKYIFVYKWNNEKMNTGVHMRVFIPNSNANDTLTSF